MLESVGHSEGLQHHMYKMYQDGSMCDVEIVTQDGVTFRAHRLVLTASSAYLYNMCMQMASGSSFYFDIHSEVLHILMEFCYTGHLYIAADKWTSIQEAAHFLQMYNVLELLNGQSNMGTITSCPDAGNQLVATQNNLTDIGKQGQLSRVDEEVPNDMREVAIKLEITAQDEDRTKAKSAMENSGKVKDTYYATRSSSRRQKNTASIPNAVEDSNNAHHDYESRQKLRKTKSAPYTEVKGHTEVIDEDTDNVPETATKRKVTGVDLHSEPNTKMVTNKNLPNEGKNSRQVIESDPDYEPVTNFSGKVKGKTRNNIRTRSKGSRSELTGVNLLGEDSKGRILIRIKNSKIERKIGCKKKRRSVNYCLSRICVPKNSNRICPQCNKKFTSAVLLHIHQLYAHFSKNCSQLRHNHLVKLAKRKSDMNSCLLHTDHIDRRTLTITCKLCRRKFSKYCQFTLHQRKMHKGNAKPVESWLRYCSVKLAMQKLLVPFAKDRKSNHTTTSKSYTRAHDKKVKERTFRCEDCNKMFLTRYTLATHRKNIHGDVSGQVIMRAEKVAPPEPLFVCLECKKSERTMRALYNHLQVKHEYTSSEANRLQHCLPDSLKCEVCEFKTPNLQKMKNHVIETHPSVRYQCTDCPMTFKVELMLKRHKFMCHVLGKFNFHCQMCQKSFRKGSMLKKHEYFKHGVQHENIKIFHCGHEGCTYKTYASTAIKLHQSKHNKEKLFPCNYCGHKLKTEKIREKHIAKMHLGIRPFLCQVCGLSFGEKHELQSHITNRHSSERNFQCQYCSYTTAVKGTFFTHLFNVHKVRAEDDKRELFRCPHCPFTSILKYRYQTHVNGHTNTRNYECKVCNKSFVSANTLRSHNQWVHSDKVYSCTQCDYQTKTTQKLNEHIRVQHQLQGFKPYKCPYCTFRCATGGNTRKHVKQVHKGEVVTYIRDDDLLTAARMARSSGHYASLFNTLSGVQLSHEVSEDERSELSENILHIAL